MKSNSNTTQTQKYYISAYVACHGEHILLFWIDIFYVIKEETEYMF